MHEGEAVLQKFHDQQSVERSLGKGCSGREEWMRSNALDVLETDLADKDATSYLQPSKRKRQNYSALPSRERLGSGKDSTCYCNRSSSPAFLTNKQLLSLLHPTAHAQSVYSVRYSIGLRTIAYRISSVRACILRVLHPLHRTCPSKG